MWVSNLQPLCSLLGEKEPTAFVTVLWCSSQSKWSPIFCKLLSSPSLVAEIHDAKSKYQHSVTNKNQTEKEKAQTRPI